MSNACAGLRSRNSLSDLSLSYQQSLESLCFSRVRQPAPYGYIHCYSLGEEVRMNRKFSVLAVLLVLFAVACGSMNRVLPSEVDAKAMEADVRSKIAEAVPEKTFAVEVTVDNHAVVTLSGHAASQSDINKIVDAAKSVSGVKSVINNLHVK